MIGRRQGRAVACDRDGLAHYLADRDVENIRDMRAIFGDGEVRSVVEEELGRVEDLFLAKCA